MTHLLPGHQEQTSHSAIQDLSRDDVHEQQFTPAAVQQLHLVTHLEAERVKTSAGLSSSSVICTERQEPFT